MTVIELPYVWLQRACGCLGWNDNERITTGVVQHGDGSEGFRLVVREPGDVAKFLIRMAAVEVTEYGENPYQVDAFDLAGRGEMYGANNHKYAYFPGAIVSE